MTHTTQNEEWEGKFSSLFNSVIDGGITNFLNSHLDVKREYFKSIKKRIEQKPFLDFIRQQRQEAYEEGVEDTVKQDPYTEILKKQAVKEFAELIEKEFGDDMKGNFKGGILTVEKWNKLKKQALEVY